MATGEPVILGVKDINHRAGENAAWNRLKRAGEDPWMPVAQRVVAPGTQAKLRICHQERALLIRLIIRGRVHGDSAGADAGDGAGWRSRRAGRGDASSSPRHCRARRGAEGDAPPETRRSAQR